jgi:hypothetical protein
MQRSGELRPIVSKCVVYAKKADTPLEVSAFLLPLTRTDGESPGSEGDFAKIAFEFLL